MLTFVCGCAQLSYTPQHGAVLIIFPALPQATAIAEMHSNGEEEG